jgi:subtilisin family serine protease
MPRTLLLAILVSSISLASARPAPGQELRWRSGATLAHPDGSAGPSQGELLERLRSAGERHVLVRFEHGPSEHERELWSAAGLELGRALGAGAYFARVRPRRLATRGTGPLSELLDARELALEWKLHPLLLGDGTPPWTVVARDASGAATVALDVLLQDDVPLERGDARLAELGGSRVDVLESVHGIVALLPRARVAELAAADEVAWVEPVQPPWEDQGRAAPAATAAAWTNDSNRARVEVDALQAPPYDLDGSGVTVLVYDGGPARESHVDFGGRLRSNDGPGADDHATHVSATIGGSGAASGGRYRGMAPGVTIESYAFRPSPGGYALFDLPGDLESDYAAALALGAVLSNNSLGSHMESFNCSLEGVYSVTDGLVDAIVRGSLGAPMRVAWAAGNARGATSCDVEGFGAYYSLSSPATAKNPITIGAVNSNDGSMTSFSSWGPTDDGRMKPDLCAPGCQAGGDGGVTSAGGASDVDYVTICGTSMACPTACGVMALVLQDYRAQFGGPDPLNATLKALLAHTALDLGNPGPDHASGYGLVRARAAVDFLRQRQVVESSVAASGASQAWPLVVPPDTAELRLTLAWDDVPAQPNVLGSLVNDLDLSVRDPLGAQHHVWTLDPLAPGAPATRTQPNHRDNLEQVVVAAPMAGTWSVEVVGFDVGQGPQSFALTSSEPLGVAPRLEFTFPEGLPLVLTAGAPTSVRARIVGVGDAVVPGSPSLHVRYDGGAFLALPLVALGNDLYEGRLPPPVCTSIPAYSFSAEGLAGPATSPPNAPVNVYTALVDALAPVFHDDFESDHGWSVTTAPLGAGAWQRGTPVGGGMRGDPPAALGGSGQCFLTGNAPGNSDVDRGPTTLVSPLFDASGGGVEISFARWFTTSGGQPDALSIEVSSDDGASWTLVESVAGGPPDAWVPDAFLLDDFIAPSDRMRVRFSVTDLPDDSITEAGIDAFRVDRHDCPPLPDCDGNGILDADDIQSGRARDFDGNGIPDRCEHRARPSPGRPPGP